MTTPAKIRASGPCPIPQGLTEEVVPCYLEVRHMRGTPERVVRVEVGLEDEPASAV
jgi:hypothetical protein